MNKSMRKLFGKIVIRKGEDRALWPSILYVYDQIQIRSGDKLAGAILGSNVYKRDMAIGLPLVSKASDYRSVKPTERQCRNFIRNTFNAF
jgi:hypothetical protein